MANPTEEELVARVTERLRRDHPDPAQRARLYDGDKLARYVSSVAQDIDDDAVLDRVVAGVRAAEDGEPA